MTKREVLKIILENLSDDCLVFSTTGLISREVFFLKDRPENFYMLGSMGLVTPLALGVALSRPEKKIIVIEGDGSVLLNLGALVMVGAEKPSNFWHIVLDNESYESTGGQPSLSNEVDISLLAEKTGYKNVKKFNNRNILSFEWKEFLKRKGPNFLLIKIGISISEEPPRVMLSPEEIKIRFRRII